MCCGGRRLDLLTQRVEKLLKQSSILLWSITSFCFGLVFLSNKVETQAGSSLILLLAECAGWHRVSILSPPPIAMCENWFNIWLLWQMHPCRGTKYAQSMCLAKLKHLRSEEFQLFTIKRDIHVDVRDDIFKECAQAAFPPQVMEQYGKGSTNASSKERPLPPRHSTWGSCELQC